MLKQRSLVSLLASLTESERVKVVNSLTARENEVLLYDWELKARLNQLPPDTDWYVWLLLSGRGAGKTRAGNEQVIKWAKEKYSPIALVGQTKADVRDTIIEIGDSSILKISPPWFMPEYEPSKRRVIWPNGVIGIIYSGDEPDQLRGPQHAKAEVDELCKFKYPQQAWDNLMFGLRVGDKPQVVVTTTPRPIPTLKKIMADSKTVISRAHTLENKANLPPSFLKYVLDRYEGTRLGRQELAGEVLDDNPNALWKREWIDRLRLREHPPLQRIVVGVDPAATSSEESSETGIVVAGAAVVGGRLHGYVLDDLSLRASPSGWATAALTGYHKHQADRIIGEVNNGGEMVENTIRSIEQNVSYKAVHASRGKALRAEPISALYEQGRVHHIGFFPDLEDQLCEWVAGDKSPDRLDAAVWALTELMLGEEEQEVIVVFDAMKEFGLTGLEL